MATRRLGHFLRQGWLGQSKRAVLQQDVRAVTAAGPVLVENGAAAPSALTESTQGTGDGSYQGSSFGWGATWGVTAGLTTAAMVSQSIVQAESAAPSAEPTSPQLTSKPTVIFVLGGPGSGKGTQCANIVQEYGFVHLSAGDLLRDEIKSGSKHGNMIAAMIKEGKIVPSSVTVGLLEKAMAASGKNKFLIDGFPRNNENREAFERDTGIQPDFILFFDCPEEVMEQRLLKRGQNSGRTDDNIETIKKRFRVFVEQSMPVVEHYELHGKVRKITGTRNPLDVFASLRPYFRPYLEADVLEANQALLDAIESADYATYARYCDTHITAYEPESQGYLVEGLPFHKFYFDQISSGASSPSSSPAVSTIVSPKVKLLSDTSALVTYVRLRQSTASSRVGFTDACVETRVWERRKGADGRWQWRNIHFHRSSTPSE